MRRYINLVVATNNIRWGFIKMIINGYKTLNVSDLTINQIEKIIDEDDASYARDIAIKHGQETHLKISTT